MLNSFSSWLYTVATVVGLLLTLLSIYAILTRSSLDMKLYKYCLLKLTICDLVFSLTLAVILRPDILFPLPAGAFNGVCVLFGRPGAITGLCATIVSAMTIFTAINDCCYTRAMIVFERHESIDFIFSKKGLIFVISVNIIFGCFVCPAIIFALIPDEVFLRQATASNRMHILEEHDIGPNTVILAVDLNSWHVVPLIVVVGGGLIILHSGNFIASWLTWRRLNQGKQHMSSRTFQQHRMLTIMLVCQNLYPIISISVPCALLGFTTLIRLSMFPESDFIKHSASLAVILYPAMSSLCNFYFVRPYREFIVRKMRRIPILKIAIKPEITRVENTQSYTMG